MSKAVLGNNLLLVQKIFAIYHEIIKRGNINIDHINDECYKTRLLILKFCCSCQYNFMMAILSIMKGHINDSYYFSRKATECCTFAYRLNTSPNGSDAWLNAVEDYKNYKNEFREPFDKKNQILDELFKRYDLCCKYTHPSIFSVAGQLEIIEGKFIFKYFQIDKSNIELLDNTFLWTAQTHIYIIKIYIEIFKKECYQDVLFLELWNNLINDIKSKEIKLNGI
jgi:hypothetical protein